MSLVGIRDLSVLEEPPIDRQPIQTYVMEQHDEIIKEAIRRELARRGQVYYVYNRVNNIAEVSAHVQSLVPDATVAYAHGQMAERELEKIMLEFINGEIDVLVSTTIIETGLDIPNANTMIIQDADHLGLSQLYQLRGRVGRSSRTSYAFLLYRRGKLLNAEAQKRLKAIREFTELGSGIKIAMRDLEIRGAGNVLGAEQHGHMQAVGYELYCKLLGVAVRALKGEEVEKEEFETSVDVDISAYIPSSYIKNEEQKLDVYKRIASIETLDDYLDMQDELLDRFGEMNSAVDNLLTVARVKSLAHNVYITEIKIEKQEVHMQFYSKAKVNLEKLPELLEAFSPELSIRHGEEVELIYRQRKKQTDCTNSLEKTLEIVERMNTLLLKVQNSLTKESKKDIN
jgi:TRCF domain